MLEWRKYVITGSKKCKKIYTTRFGGNQVQALADLNFSVEKGESGGRTFTRVIQLDREARKAELARITGGSQVTPPLLESAGELLDQADAYRKQHFV